MTTYTLAINGEQMGNQQVRCNIVSKCRRWGVVLLRFYCLNGSVKFIYLALLRYLFIYRDSSKYPGTDWLISFSRWCH